MKKIIGPQIDAVKCNGCGLCISVCEHHGLALVEHVVAFVGEDDCTWCGTCEAVCTLGAIGCPYEILIEDDRPPESRP
jgi:ferredoxin